MKINAEVLRDTHAGSRCSSGRCRRPGTRVASRHESPGAFCRHRSAVGRCPPDESPRSRADYDPLALAVHSSYLPERAHNRLVETLVGDSDCRRVLHVSSLFTPDVDAKCSESRRQRGTSNRTVRRSASRRRNSARGVADAREALQGASVRSGVNRRNGAEEHGGNRARGPGAGAGRGSAIPARLFPQTKRRRTSISRRVNGSRAGSEKLGGTIGGRGCIL